MPKKPDWVIKDFSGGLNDKVDDNLIADNESPDCQNVIANKIGSLTKVLGSAKLNAVALGSAVQGLHSYYYGSYRKLIVVSNGRLYYWNTVGSAFSEITLPVESYPEGLDTSASVYFETLVNYAVGFNGKNKPFKVQWNETSSVFESSVLANAPADGQFPCLFKEKLFTVPKSDPSTLVWSNSFAPETWEGVNYWDIAKGDGDVITNLTPYLGELTIFKRYSTHTIRGTYIDDFRYDEINPNVGCVGPRACVQEDTFLYFVADDGIYKYNGGTMENLTRPKIPNLWATINNEYIGKAVAGRWEGLLWFALPKDSNSFNNLVLLHDPLTGAWWPRTGLNISCLAEYNTGSKTKFYSGSSLATSPYVAEQWVGNNDLAGGTIADPGTKITSYWKGKAFDMGNPAFQKKAKKMLVADGNNTNDAIPAISLDYGDYQELTYLDGDDLIRRFNCPSAWWRYFQPKLTHDVIDKSFEVRGLTLQYKAKGKAK